MTNDRPAFQAAVTAAIDAGGGIVSIPPGNYSFDATPLTLGSNIHLRGSGRDITTITLNSTMADSAIKAVGSYSNVGISDLTLDINNNITGNNGGIFYQGLDNCFVRDVKIVHMVIFGIVLQICTNFDVSFNEISLDTAVNTQNEGILVTDAGQSSDGRISYNTLTNTGMEVDGERLVIAYNTISNWKFGGGITNGPNAFSHDNLIIGNKTFGSSGIDVNGTIVTGLEIWGARTLIANNIAWNNSGPGIMVGGRNSVVCGNICYDNCQQAVAGNKMGLLIQYSAAMSADHAVVTGNSSFNLNGTTQDYGLTINQLVIGAVVADNTFYNNQIAAIQNNFLTAQGLVFGATSNLIPAEITNPTDWTPTLGAVSGAFTSIAAIDARYTQVGKIVTGFITIHQVTNGTAAGGITFTLPITPLKSGAGVGLDTNSRHTYSVQVLGGNGTATASRYDGGLDTTDGNFFSFVFSYEVA